MDTPQPEPAPRASLVWRSLRALRVVLITLFVCWQLLFLLVRNPLDLWKSEILTNGLRTQDWFTRSWVEIDWPDKYEPDAAPEVIEVARAQKWKISPDWFVTKLDDLTGRYASYLGLDQGWSMFTPPMWSKAYFPEVELHFNDGTTALVYSPNAPDTAQRGGLQSGYIRLGGWRQRKLEDYILKPTNDEGDKPVSTMTDKQVFQAYIRWSVRRWQEKHPDDPRIVVKVGLYYQTVHFPRPGEDPTRFRVRSDLITWFHPSGELVKP